MYRCGESGSDSGWAAFSCCVLAVPGLRCVGDLVAAHDGLHAVRDAYARPAGWGTRIHSECDHMYLVNVWRRVLGWGP